MTNKTWTVWVGGVEINDYYMTHARALEVAETWRSNGYDEVAIENHAVEENNA